MLEADKILPLVRKIFGVNIKKKGLAISKSKAKANKRAEIRRTLGNKIRIRKHVRAGLKIQLINILGISRTDVAWMCFALSLTNHNIYI